MKIFFMSLILSFSVYDLIEADKLKFQDCSNGNGIVTVNRFTLSPDPISLSEDVSASVHLTLHEDIPRNTFVKRNIYKITSLFGFHIPAPCIGEFGSCTTEGCKYLRSLKTQVCPFFPPGLECDCPLKAGTYSGNNITIPMPELGPVIKFLASGYFKIEWKLVQKDDWVEKDLICFVITGMTKA